MRGRGAHVREGGRLLGRGFEGGAARKAIEEGRHVAAGHVREGAEGVVRVASGNAGGGELGHAVQVRGGGCRIMECRPTVHVRPIARHVHSSVNRIT